MPKHCKLADSPASFPLPPFVEDRVTRAEAANIIGLSRHTLESDATRQQLGLPFYRVGSRVFYRRSDLDRWLEARRIAKGE